MEKTGQLHYNSFKTPLGTMIAAGNDNGICLLEYEDRLILEPEFALIQNRLKTSILQGTNQMIEKLKFQLDEYFNGNLKQFDIGIITVGTRFQNEVWQILQNIPFGQTISYQVLAASLGNPNALRAVARANGSNRIAIVIPCHRVIGKNGQLTGYRGGIWRKVWLLNHEKTLLKADKTNVPGHENLELNFL
jgi:AraC family transcriptional regulator, regulatory protein of adaptative response / methylated-DNA-[protein]-cysteine methyltransferase